MGLSDRIVAALKVSLHGSEEKHPDGVGGARAPQPPVLSLASNIKDRYGELQILHELSQTILASPDIQTTLSAALKAILATIGFDVGNIRLFDASGRLTHSACLGYLDERNTRRYLTHTGKDAAGIFGPRVIASKRSLIIEDVIGGEGLRTFKLEGVRSAILVPIATDNETLGIITAGSRSGLEVPPEKVRLLEAMGAQIGIALQKARLFDEMQRTAQEQAALSAVTIAASRTLDVRDVLGEALEKVLEVTGRERGTIRFKDDLTGHITLAEHRGFSPSEVSDIRQTSGRMAENVFATGKSSVLNDTTAAPIQAALLPDVGSLAAVPIVAGKEVVGVLTVSAKRPIPFERREVDFLESIGHVIGVAVQNSRHYLESLRGQEVQKLLKELSQDITALDIGELFQKITDKVREFFKVDISDIRLLDEQGSRRVVGVSGTDAGNVYQLGGIRGRTAWIVEHRRPLVIADAVIDQSIPTGEALSRLGIRGYAAAPLFGRSGEVIGILRALSFEPRKFSETEIDLLQQLANGIAIALENARLFEETRTSYRETQVLNEIAQVVLGGLDLKTMAQRILNKAVELGSFDFGTVVMTDGKWHEAIAHFGYRDGGAIARRYEIASGNRMRSLATKDWVVVEDVEQTDGMKTLHQEGVKSAVLVPIVVEGENGGVLQLGSRTLRNFDSRELPLLKGIANLLGIGLQKARLFQETEQHAQEQATISAIAMAVSQSHEQEDLLRIALDKVLEATGRDRGYILLKDPATGHLALAAHKGVSPRYAEFLKTHRRHRGETGKTARVIKTGEPLIINNEKEVGRETSRDGQRVIARIPIKAGGRVVGVLNVASRRPEPFATREVELLQAIGNVIGVALENAWLYQESRQQQEIQTLLKELSQDITGPGVERLLTRVAEKVREAFQIDLVDFRIFEEGTGKFIGRSGEWGQHVTTSDTLRRRMKWILEQRRPLMVPDVSLERRLPRGELHRLGVKGFLGVPLFSRGGEIVGVLRALTYAPREFRQEQIDFLQQLANGTAIAIENARLFEETKRRQEEQTAINAIAMATTTSMRVDELLNIALKKVLEVTGRERGSIKLKDPATGRIVLTAHRGISQQYADTIRSHFAPEEKASQIFESGEVVIVDDPEKNLFDLNDREAGLRSLIWVPLKARGAVIGILNVSSPLSNPFTEREIELLKGVGNVIGIAIENARLFEETERRGREQAALYAVTAAVGSSFDVDQTLVKVLDTVLETTGIDGGYIYLFDGQPRQAVMKAHRGMSEAFIARMQRTHIGAKTAQVIETKEPLIAENIPADHQGKFHGEQITAAAWVPIVAKSVVVGILAVCTKNRPDFPRLQLPLLLSIGNALGVGLENARLFQETDRHLKRLQALREIDRAISSTLDLDSVLKILLEKIDVTLPYASATIRLMNRRTGLLEPVACRNLDEDEWKKEKAGRGIPNVVFATKSPLVIRDVRSDPRATDIEFYRKHDLISYVGVPLIVEDEIIGVLGFYTKEEHDFEPEEISFLETLAGQAAIALQNSRLYEEARLREAQLEESNRMLTTLHAAVAATSQTLDLERVLRSVIEKITEIFNFGTTQIHIYDPARDELVLGGYFDSDQHVTLAVRSFRMGEGVVGTVAATGKAVVFEDIATDDSYRKLSRSGRAGELGNRFFAVFPIRGKLKNHGTLAFTAVQPRRLSAGETKLIEALTDQLAIAIENSKLYDELKQKVGELLRANKVKDEFLSVMSHELRTPLNVVIGYASLIREGMLGQTNIEQDRALDKIVGRTHELLSMITGILYATSIEANEVQVDSIAFPLGGLMDEIKRAYAAPLSKPVTLEWNYPADLPVVRSDPDKIRWILQSLMDNGIKFTEHGRVALMARVVDGWMEFQISDTGIGILEEKVALIFDKFRQADGSETRRYGGIGLGLYIAQSFTRLLGGTIAIDSAPERGSTFTVKLPCGRVFDTTARAAVDEARA